MTTRTDELYYKGPERSLPYCAICFAERGSQLNPVIVAVYSYGHNGKAQAIAIFCSEECRDTFMREEGFDRA